jgi:VWFA-related protein
VLALPPARPSPATAQERPRFGTGSEVVVLDVVVRDRKGRTVRDIRPDELVVLEDGVPQETLSFRLRAAGEAPGDAEAATAAEPAAPAKAAPEPPTRRAAAKEGSVNLVTLVFDQLGASGRPIARRAGLALAGLTERADLLVSVFTIRERLGLVQQFTNERALVEAAVQAATSSLDTGYLDATALLEEAVAREAESRRFLEAAGAGTAPGQAGTLAGLAREVAVARMAVDALRMTDTLQREQQGQSSLYSLLALARQQHRLAGRKTILFFSEGIQVPPSLEHVFRSTISEANRANVSIYTIDARGLTEERDLQATRRVLEAAAAAAQREMMSRGVGAVPKDQVLALDDAERSLRLDLQGALNDLAESTGGALIANSNDVRPGIERAVGDLRGYYEVVYAPSNTVYDGRFRSIAVRLARPDLRVQTRSGYFALPPGEGTATFPFEIELLKALRADPLPAAVEVHASSFRFGPEPGGVRHTAVLEVPLAGISFEPDDRGETDRAHVSILLVVRDSSGSVVEKFSEDSPVFLPRTQRAALKRGNAVFLRSFALAPGRYTLEVAVVDQLARRFGTQRSALVVGPPAAAGLELSQLVLIKRTEAVAAGALRSEDPFRQGGTRLVPWLGEPHVGRGEALSLFAVAYPRRDAQGDVLLEFVRDGELVGQSLAPLPAAGEAGRAPFIASVPMLELRPGRYEARLLVKQGGLVAQRSARFVLDDALSPPAR